MPSFELLGYSIDLVSVFFGLLSFIVYKAISIEDKDKFKYLDILMIILLGIFNVSLINYINIISNLDKTNSLILIIYLPIAILSGFLASLAERLFHHKLVPKFIDIFSKLGINSIDLDDNNEVLHKVLRKVYKAIDTKKVPIDKIRIEIFMKNGKKIRGFLIGYSLKDLNLITKEGKKLVLTNILRNEMQTVRIITHGKYSNSI